MGSSIEAERSENQPIVVVSKFQKEVAELEGKYRELLKLVQEAEQSESASTLEHLLLFDAAIEEAQSAVEKAVEQSRGLVKSCIGLNRALRGTDRLAERSRQLRQQAAELERILDTLLKD